MRARINTASMSAPDSSCAAPEQLLDLRGLKLGAGLLLHRPEQGKPLVVRLG